MNTKDPTVRVSLSLPKSQVVKLDALAQKRHITRSAMTREILRRLFDRAKSAA